MARTTRVGSGGECGNTAASRPFRHMAPGVQCPGTPMFVANAVIESGWSGPIGPNPSPLRVAHWIIGVGASVIFWIGIDGNLREHGFVLKAMIRMWKNSFCRREVRPKHALLRFDGFGKPGEGFSGAKGLVNNQTESAGADEPTAPRRERRGCRWNNRSAAPLRGCYRCVPCAGGR